jgi:hypothetical protein
MHAKRFSSVKQSTQGFAGDVSSLSFFTGTFEDDDSAVFISFVVIVDARAFVSAALDSDDVVISTSLPSDKLVANDLNAACSRA